MINQLRTLILLIATLTSTIGFAESRVDEFCKDAGVSSQHRVSKSVSDILSLVDEICGLHLGINNKEPDLINKAIQPWISSDNGLAFLKDVDFKIKAFENEELQKSGLGFSYDYSKSKELAEYRYSNDGNTIGGYAWSFKAKGNVAFDDEINPGDFLDTRLSVSGFRHSGGFHQGGTQQFDKYNDLEDKRADAETQDELRRIDSEQKNIIDAVRSHLGARNYIELDINAGLESDQQFSQKQWSYGAQLALDYKSYDRDAWQTTFNIFDWPFAAIRVFTGYDPANPGFQPLGSTIPTVIFGLDQVDPKDNDAREMLGEDSTFDRFRSEVYFRTPIAYISQSEIWFNFDWRYSKERDAPDVIEDANLDSFNYRTISISSSNGVFLSYRKGKLPFDLETQEAYEIGWKFNLNSLR